VLHEDYLLQMEQNIPIILCKLERIFPHALFDSMEHQFICLMSLRWVDRFNIFLSIHLKG